MLEMEMINADSAIIAEVPVKGERSSSWVTNLRLGHQFENQKPKVSESKMKPGDGGLDLKDKTKRNRDKIVDGRV